MQKAHSRPREARGAGECLVKLWCESEFIIPHVLSSLFTKMLSVQSVLFLFSFLGLDLLEGTTEFISAQ